jgi:hypothetical protein
MIFDNLLDSFVELERAIESAKTVVSKAAPEKQELIGRFDSYHEILDKQRTLAKKLSSHALRRNWSEVSRHIKIINGLSQMIRDDAQEILRSVEIKQPVAHPVEKVVQ